MDANKYSRLVRSSYKDLEAKTVAYDLESIIKHFEEKLSNIESWLGQHKELLKDAVLGDEKSIEYAFSQLGCKLMLTEVLELLEGMRGAE